MVDTPLITIVDDFDDIINPPITATEVIAAANQFGNWNVPLTPWPTPGQIFGQEVLSSWSTASNKPARRKTLKVFNYVNDKAGTAESLKPLEMEVTMNEVYTFNLRPHHGVNPEAFVRAVIVGRQGAPAARFDPAAATASTFSNERFTIDVVPEDLHLAHKIMGKGCFMYQADVHGASLETNRRSIIFASWFMLQQTLSPPIFNPYKDPDWV